MTEVDELRAWMVDNPFTRPSPMKDHTMSKRDINGKNVPRNCMF